MSTNSTAKPAHSTRFDVRKMVFTALLSAMAVVLMKYLGFTLPFVPWFLTFDFSDIPAVLAALTMGPVSGVTVCLIKNIGGYLAGSATGGVGEISNFILSVMLVVPAGIIAQKTHSYKGVIIACVSGAFAMALGSIVTNYFFVYPLYTVVMPMEVIIGTYRAINPNVNSLIECLLMFNVPFTLAKGLIAVGVSIPLYKKLRPIFNSNFSGK